MKSRILIVTSMLVASAFAGSTSRTGSGAQSLLPTTASAEATETCFSKGEKVDGMNKICYYSCPSGTAAITIKSIQLCPLNIKR